MGLAEVAGGSLSLIFLFSSWTSACPPNQPMSSASLLSFPKHQGMI